ncbi:hypothetical protein D1007_34254 [Hordeum vulgare]|nr:hypothetical protein D1007_34254 [Hordeum vulgare]
MVASSASSAAATDTDFTHRGEAFGADAAIAARSAIDTAHAHAYSSAIAAFGAANAAMAGTLATGEMEWVKKEYFARELLSLGKIKYGGLHSCFVASSRMKKSQEARHATSCKILK